MSALLLLFLGSVLGDCVIDPDSASSWPTWPPILTNTLGDFILATGAENKRQIVIESDQVDHVDCGVGLLTESVLVIMSRLCCCLVASMEHSVIKQ